MRPTGFGYGGYTAGDPEKMMKEAEQLKDIRFKPSPGILKVIPGMEVMRENATFRPVTPLPLSPDLTPGGGYPVNKGTRAMMEHARQEREKSYEVTPYPLNLFQPPVRRNYYPKNKEEVYPSSSGATQQQAQESPAAQSVSAAQQQGTVAGTGEQPADNVGAAGNNMSRQSITIAGREWPLVGKPGTFERVPVKGGGMAFIGYTGGDDTRNFQYAIRHEPVRRRSAQQAQPRGLHYVPGGWANDGYSFDGSAEDRARFFAPVSGPGRAPRSDNDTFLALQRQKAMQPVEQPLPERPEFPADPRMGWHTKLAKYQADMDAYNRQMANIAGYRQAMDVAALQQMPKPTDPVEQARLERALALQERQAAQQSAYNQAQLDQQERMNQYNQMTGMADYFTKMNQLGYQQREAELVDNYRRALLAGDAKAADAAKAVLEVYRGKEVKDDNKNGKFAHATSEDAMGNKKIVIYNTRNGEVVNNANIPSMDTPEAVKMRQDNSAYLEEIKKRASPKQQEELAGLEPFINHPNFKAMVDEYMRKGR